MIETDTYRTILNAGKGKVFKDRNSKFIGYIYLVNNNNDVKQFITQLKKEHHSASHWCYAYKIGHVNAEYRANDDGEPNNSAGKPIYGQIQSFNITNVLIVVVRYYGGTNLGVSGLINAYRTAAKNAILACNIIETTINDKFKLIFEYKHLSKIMRILKEYELHILHQKMEMNCEVEISVRKSKSLFIMNIFKQIHDIEIIILS